MKKVMSVVLCIIFVACAVCGCSGAASQKFSQKFSLKYGGKEIALGDKSSSTRRAWIKKEKAPPVLPTPTRPPGSPRWTI